MWVYTAVDFTEDDPSMVDLVQKIIREPNLNFVGLLSHAGHTYGADDAEAARQNRPRGVQDYEPCAEKTGEQRY